MKLWISKSWIWRPKFFLFFFLFWKSRKCFSWSIFLAKVQMIGKYVVSKKRSYQTLLQMVWTLQHVKRLSWRHWLRQIFGEHAMQQNHICNGLALWLHLSVLGLQSMVARIIIHKPGSDAIRRQSVTRFSRILLCAFQAYLRKAKLFDKSGREIKPNIELFVKWVFQIV